MGKLQLAIKIIVPAEHAISLYYANYISGKLLSDVNSRSSLINPATFLVFNF